MKRISPLKFLILTLVTFGIYGLAMWVRMTRNLNKMSEMVGQKKIMGFIPQLLLGGITMGIVTLVWMIKFYSKMSSLNAAKNAGVKPANGFLMFIFTCIPIYSYIWMAEANNKLCDAYEA